MMGQIITASLPFGAYGLDVLRRVVAPHYGAIAVKTKLMEAVNLCYSHVPQLTHRNQLQVALNLHLKALKYMHKNGQALCDTMILVGLNTLVANL